MFQREIILNGYSCKTFGFCLLYKKPRFYTWYFGLSLYELLWSSDLRSMGTPNRHVLTKHAGKLLHEESDIFLHLKKNSLILDTT